MEPLIVLTVVTLALRAAGAAGVTRLARWRVALRGGLSAMFVLTGVAHFVGMRAELIEMLPPALPAPALLITLTGLLELAGAAGLLWSRTAPWAAGGLLVLLIAMFPANVHAALSGLATDPLEQLLPRTLIQVVFVAAAAVVAEPVLRRRLPAASRPVRARDVADSR